MPLTARKTTALVCTAAAILIFCFGASSSEAGAPGSWTVLGSGIRSVSGQVGVARTADGVLHVVWSRGGPGTPWELLETTASPAGQVAAPRSIVSGWSRIDDVAAAAFAGRPLSVVFTGTKTDTTGDPTEGLNLATGSGGDWTVGSSAIYGSDEAGSSVPSVGFTRTGTFVQAWSGNGKVFVHVGIDPAVPAQSVGDGGNVAVVGWNEEKKSEDERERILVAWCASDAGIKSLEFGSDVPAAVNVLPGSETTRCPAASRTAYTRESYPSPSSVDNSSAAASVNAEREVRFWFNAFAQPITVAGGPGIKQQVATAADPNHRVWVGWRDADSGKLFFRRSNGARTFGAVVSTPIPASEDSLYNLDLAAQGDRVDVIARTTKDSAVSLFHTQLFPGLTVAATSKRGRVTVLVTDAGTPVRNSTVTLTGGHRLHTGADGRAHIKLPSGRYRVRAQKNKYVGATTSVLSRRR